MASTKERQKIYRTNRMDAGDTRLCIWVSNDCKAALQAITNHLDVSQKDFVERMIKKAASVLSSTPIAAT